MEGIKRLIVEMPDGERVVAPPTENLKTVTWRMAADLLARALNLETRIPIVERTPSAGRGKAAQFIPIYGETREGDLLHTLLKDFTGILVSDFYAAYDGIRCRQQKCLIHLIRDLNDDVLKHPYDEELKRLAQAFAGLVRPMVGTVDRHGLKSRFLRKHRVSVDRFYRQLSTVALQSQAAVKLRDRFQKNREKLFTFLDYDGVPWNNNNAEHAVKAFATLRNVIGGCSTEKGIREYLILLSICETCKYKGLDFLDFLRSGEKNIDAFASCL